MTDDKIHGDCGTKAGRRPATRRLQGGWFNLFRQPSSKDGETRNQTRETVKRGW
jgi:hypothetical protein